MKKNVFIIGLITCLLLCLNTLHAQNVAINETDSLPHPSAILDIASSDKGVLIPRVKLISRSDNTTISSPETSLLVFNDTVNSNIDRGFYYWNGEAWEKLLTNEPWLLEGNSGTSPATNFLGTTDNVDLVFRTNNTEYVRIKSDGDVGIGTTTPQRQLSITKSFAHPHTSSSSIGVIYKDTIRFIHNYKHASATGNNLFIGLSGGNFSLASSSVYNTGVGDSTLTALTSGHSNTALGFGSLKNITTGTSNISIGYKSLYSNLTQGQNIAIGHMSMSQLTTGIYCIGLGTSSLANNNKDHIIAIGDSTLVFNGQNTEQWWEGRFNIAIGSKSQKTNTSGFCNVSIGFETLENLTTAAHTIAIGSNALHNVTTGNFNIAIGSEALENVETGGHNTAIGFRALYNQTDGGYNTAVGHESGIHYNGNQSLYSTFIGYGAKSNTDSTITNSAAIGNAATVNASNKIVIGNASVSWIGGNSRWYSNSDNRYKTNVTENVKGLDFIMLLKPVTYNMKAEEMADYYKEDYHFDENTLNFIEKQPSQAEIEARNLKSSIVYSGFIAQEVESAAQQCGYNFSGVKPPENKDNLYSLSYSDFVVPLVKATQEQQEIIEGLLLIIDDLKTRIEELEKITKE